MFEPRLDRPSPLLASEPMQYLAGESDIFPIHRLAVSSILLNVSDMHPKVPSVTGSMAHFKGLTTDL